MFAVAGTVPDENFPLMAGKIHLKNDMLYIQGESVPVNRGTSALMASAVKTCELLGKEMPLGFLAGDIGLGKGSRLIYEYLTKNLKQSDLEAITFHYLQPDVDWHNRVLFAIQEMTRKPVLIADAGFMYAAKMSGQAPEYDLFTPDVGELAFLADEEAPHPFYTRGFILHDDNNTPDLIDRAYRHNNAAGCLLVKGQPDHVADRQGILSAIGQPTVEAMEAIGGTGDTLTGIVTALIGTGTEIGEAAATACMVNRMAGFHAKLAPADQVTDIIRQIPRAFTEIHRYSPCRLS